LPCTSLIESTFFSGLPTLVRSAVSGVVQICGISRVEQSWFVPCHPPEHCQRAMPSGPPILPIRGSAKVSASPGPWRLPLGHRDRRNPFAAQNSRSAQNRLHRFQIARTAAQNARKRFAHFILARIRVFLPAAPAPPAPSPACSIRIESRRSPQTPAGSRSARRFSSSPAPGAVPAFDGLDPVTICLHRQHRARIDRLPSSSTVQAPHSPCWQPPNFTPKYLRAAAHVQQRIAGRTLPIFLNAVDKSAIISS
jgi:hypothetical protein